MKARTAVIFAKDPKTFLLNKETFWKKNFFCVLNFERRLDNSMWIFRSPIEWQKQYFVIILRGRREIGGDCEMFFGFVVFVDNEIKKR